jgi:hypothetical protein
MQFSFATRAAIPALMSTRRKSVDNLRSLNLLELAPTLCLRTALDE